MRGNLWDDPRVSALVDATDSSEAAVVGALYWLWATADQHTEDGTLPGLTLRQVDRKTGIAGFGQAVADVGWIEVIEGGIRIVRFEEHNGASAKRRASESKRKMSARDADKLRTNDGQDAHLERELEKEIEQEQEPKQKPERASPSGSRLPVDWVLPDDYRAWCEAKHPEIDPDGEAEKFADHWHAKAGKDARKTDWLATWRNWLRSDFPKAMKARAGPQPQQPVGKQMQGLMALEAMKSGSRMVAGRGTERAAETLLLVAGSDARR